MFEGINNGEDQDGGTRRLAVSTGGFDLFVKQKLPPLTFSLICRPRLLSLSSICKPSLPQLNLQQETSVGAGGLRLLKVVRRFSGNPMSPTPVSYHFSNQRLEFVIRVQSICMEFFVFPLRGLIYRCFSASWNQFSATLVCFFFFV